MLISNCHNDRVSRRIIYWYGNVLDIIYKPLSTKRELTAVFIDRSKRKQHIVDSKNFATQPKHFQFMTLNLFNRQLSSKQLAYDMLLIWFLIQVCPKFI